MATYPADTPLSLAHLSEINTPPAELVTAAAKAGFSSVGLRVAPAAPNTPVYPLDGPGEVADLKRRMDDTGVSVLYIEIVNLDETTRVADYRRVIETGAALGATRLAVTGASTAFSLVADRLAAMADLAAEHGLAVDLEFLPYRGVASLGNAVDVVRRAARPNAHVLLDALHFMRSRSSLDLLAGLDPNLIGTVQLCDGPLAAPPQDQLVVEARTRRLLPGEGEFPLATFLAALPAAYPLGVEVPLYPSLPQLTPAGRLKKLVHSTRKFLAERNAA